MPTTKATPRSRKSRRALAFRPRLKIAVHRLPFVGKEHTEDKSFSFWNVPAKGGYMGGCNTGEAIAVMYLKHIREDDSSCCAVYLGWMVLAWMKRMSSGAFAPNSDEFDALRGQMVCFLSVISKWVDASARRLGAGLDNTTYDALLAKANGGIGFDTAAFIQYCTLKEQFEETSHA